jgi:hypothetical protein
MAWSPSNDGWRSAIRSCRCKLPCEEAAVDPNELAKEIERRKQTAKDLKLRELVWRLYGSHLEHYSKNVQKEPAAILPALQESLSIKDNRYSFSINGTQYAMVYEQGKEEKQGRRFEDDTVTTPMQFSLERGCRLVFEFTMTKSITYADDGPLFNEHMGEVTAFIDGAWVQEITAFVQELDQYRREYWAKRNAEKREHKAQSEKKRFGL